MRLPAAAVLAAFLCLPTAAAQPLLPGVCIMDRDAMLRAWADRYGEVPVARGLSAAGAAVELLASPGGSWTIVVTRPGGPPCIAQTGIGWGAVEAATVEPGDGA